MDDLLKRQNQAGAGGFEPEGLQGGDLTGGDGLQSRGLENDVGSGLELERGLDRVAAQEAWLNEQASLSVDNWLATKGLTELSFNGNEESQSFYSASESQRSLLVLDSNSQQWQSLTSNLPDNADLIVLDNSRGGFDQIKSCFDQALENGIKYSSVAIVASSESENIKLGSSVIAESEVSEEISSLNSHGLGTDFRVKFKLFVSDESFASSGLPTIETSILGSAASLTEQARYLLQKAEVSGLLDKAINASFDKRNLSSVTDRSQEFLSGVATPSISWASFGESTVKGAYISSRNEILIDSSLKQSTNLLNAVLLEEIGHWLEDSNLPDSVGDEGERFSKYLRGDFRNVSAISDKRILNIGGVLFSAELADNNDPSLSNVTVTVDENIAGTVIIHDFNDANSSSDKDADDSQLTYAIISGNSDGLFTIDTSSGEISLATNKSLDFESAQSHTLVVTGTEGDGSSFRRLLLYYQCHQ